MYNVTITSRAERELKRLDRSTRNRVVKAILDLASNPRPAGCLKVRSEEGVWRVRIGDWRVGYLIDDAASEVAVIRIAHRSEFYD
ncbi:MAG: type II toxin-antitoxin system RelE/ParE family toxin [Acidobacteria bacterium]|nr:MAG: type II toxin-antitoxin system RelE/ParE family toxin [Acidobacteriota bacterium]